jgi:hypothetical protein
MFLTSQERGELHYAPKGAVGTISLSGSINIASLRDAASIELLCFIYTWLQQTKSSGNRLNGIYIIDSPAREAGGSIKPGVERSGTPGH